MKSINETSPAATLACRLELSRVQLTCTGIQVMKQLCHSWCYVSDLLNGWMINMAFVRYEAGVFLCVNRLELVI